MTVRTLVALIPLLLIGENVAARQSRNINDIPEARESLRRGVCAKLYRSLLISPIEGRSIVRGGLAKDHLLGLKVVHSELNARYDSLALELANNLRLLNYA